MNIFWRAALTITFAATHLVADITYTKSVKYTGGTMLGFLRNLVSNPLIQRMVGADLEGALDDQSYTVYVKGSKMAQVAEAGSTIYDLDANSITITDDSKQSYEVETFEDLRAQIERAEQWMKHPKNGSAPFDVHIEKTDQTRTIEGRTAGKSLITLTAESDNAWGRPVVSVTAWLVPVESSTRPLYEFSKRAAQKLATPFTVIPSFFGASGGSMDATNSQKLNGISLLDEIAVTGVTNPITNLFRGHDRGNAPVVTLETRSSNFSNGPVSPSKFRVPEGYQQEKQRR